MLQAIEIELDANGHIHPLDSLRKLPVGRGLLIMLPPLESPQIRASELNQGRFYNLFGILKSDKGASFVVS